MIELKDHVAAVSAGAVLLGLLGFTLIGSPDASTDASDAEMVAAARAFVATLDAESRSRAVMPLEAEERFNWHFIPRDRLGLPLKDMTFEQRRAAHALLRSTLSAQGYLKATSVMQLEEVLHELENGSPRRDPELYYLTVFGTPAEGTPWGWRFEGHHLSMNYTASAGELTATTPNFWGANPAEVHTGPMAGLRVLAAEEEVARALMAALDAGQRERAVIAAEAPRDIVTGADREVRLERREGLPASEMTPAQREILMRVVEVYARNLRPDLADAHLERIRAAGVERLHFAWAGSLERGEGHYYRVHGPNVLFEYDNTQNDANHIHAVWRDLENDFGADLLSRHYRSQPHP